MRPPLSAIDRLTEPFAVDERLIVRTARRGSRPGPEMSFVLTRVITLPEHRIQSLEIVRSIYAPWGRGDFRSVGWAHPEIEFVIADLGPASGCWKGLTAMAEAWRAYLGAWEEYRTEVDEYRELDDERVLVLVRLSGRGKASGVQLEKIRTRAANLFHVRGGRVTRLVLYADRERGLADLGLSEQDAHPDSRGRGPAVSSSTSPPAGRCR